MPIRRGRVEQPISFEQFSGAYTEIADLILEITFTNLLVPHLFNLFHLTEQIDGTNRICVYKEK